MEVREVTTPGDRRRFVRFPERLYRDSPYWIPPLLRDELTTLDPAKNPAFDFCTVRLWLASRDGELVGRIAGIRNDRYIEKWDRRDIQFGWIDFVDDPLVAAALLAEVEAWGRSEGMAGILGPTGFSDFDRQGMLVEGFEELGTFATIYNHAYYPRHLESLGYAKRADWVEYELHWPEEYPERLADLARRAGERFRLRVVKAATSRDLLAYTREAFQIVNDTYRDFHGFVPLDDRQIDFYTHQFIGIVRPEYIPIVVDADDRVAAFIFAMPSLSRALQKGRGRLLPFGWLHLLRALRGRNDRLDLYLGAVRSDLQARGIHVMLMHELNRLSLARGIVTAETNLELETNHQVQSVWKLYETRRHKRRRSYGKDLSTKRDGGKEYHPSLPHDGGQRMVNRLYGTVPAIVVAAALLCARPAAAVGTDAGASAAGPPSWAGDLTPIERSDWSYARAAHLMERAGFGATPEEIERLATRDPREVVRQLVHYRSVDNPRVAGFDHSGIFDPGMDPFPTSRAEAVRIARERGEALGVNVLPDGSPRPLQPVVDKFFYGLRADRAEALRLGQWWAERMLVTARPLEEKLTFFWHGHFATSDIKVRDYRMMLAQNEMLRANANGSFRDLLVGIMKDPAMLVFLDNGENVKGHPNENFGRELLELFTLGVGNYTEHDIREASRAFTGWTNDVLDFHFAAELHDFGEKEFLGRRGNFDGEQIIDIILEQEATAEFIARKLYRFFVGEEIAPATLATLAASFRDGGYRIAPLLETIFMSRDFYSPPAFATQIKSPVQLVVSTYRKLGLDRLPTVPDFNSLTGSLGQSLFHPPNVAGWSGGRTWVTPATLLQRGNLTRDILFPPDLAAFGHPDRLMPGIYRQVGERLAQGANITTATQVGDAAASMMADADEDYNTRYGGYRGYVMAYERVRQIPRHTAPLDLRSMLRHAGVETPAEAVDHLARRFLLVPLAPDARSALIEFLEAELAGGSIGAATTETETALRGLLYLVLSTPEYQLG